MRTNILMALLLLCSPCFAADYSHCTAGLNATAKEVQVGASSSEYLNAVYSNECENNGLSKQKSAGVGLEAVIKAIPVKFTGSYGSNEEKMGNFCKVYSSETQTNQQNYSYAERVIGKALDTFEQCVRFTSQGITVQPTLLSLGASSINITAGIGKPVEVRGLTLSDNLTCSGMDPSTKKLIQFNESTVVNTSTTLGILCKRTEIVDKSGSRVYEEATVQMPLDTYGTFSLLIPKDTRLPLDQASILQKELEDLKFQLEKKSLALNARISGIKISSSESKALPAFACGGNAISGQPLEFLHGSRDGTSCGVTNVNYVRTIGLEVPPQ